MLQSSGEKGVIQKVDEVLNNFKDNKVLCNIITLKTLIKMGLYLN